MIKRFFPIAAVLVLIISNLSSCKYEEGPGISLRSRAERLANTWIIQSAIDQDGNDNTASYTTSEYTFDKEGVFTGKVELFIFGASVGTIIYNGSWVFASDDLQVQINATGTYLGLNYNFATTYDILRLAEEELWLKETGDDFEELKWVPKG